MPRLHRLFSRSLRGRREKRERNRPEKHSPRPPLNPSTVTLDGRSTRYGLISSWGWPASQSSARGRAEPLPCLDQGMHALSLDQRTDKNRPENIRRRLHWTEPLRIDPRDDAERAFPSEGQRPRGTSPPPSPRARAAGPRARIPPRSPAGRSAADSATPSRCRARARATSRSVFV